MIVLSNILNFPRKVIKKIIIYIVSSKNGAIIFYKDKEIIKIINLIKKIKAENEMLLEDNEAYQLFMSVKRTEKIGGDIAEVGVYKGGSARLICETKGNKSLHLFDTFEGLPDLSILDNPNRCNKGQFSAPFDKAKSYLKDYQKVYFHKGIFPYTSETIKNKRFSFVHLDVDLYQSTLESLKFFYPRMNKGGIIMSHDYINDHAPGVRRAFDGFFKDKPEPIIEMPSTQCLIVKL